MPDERTVVVDYRGTEIDRRLSHHLQGDDLHRQAPVPCRGKVVEAAFQTTVYPSEPAEEFARRFRLASPDLCVPAESARNDKLVMSQGEAHPRRIKYWVPAVDRIYAHLSIRPRAVAAVWSAAMLWGVPEFSDSADTVLFNRGGDKRVARHSLEPTLLRRDMTGLTWSTTLWDLQVRVAPPMMTALHCIRSALLGTHRRPVPEVPGLDPDLVRAVQVADRFMHVWQIGPEEFRACASPFIAAGRLDSVLRLADAGAESVPETTTRLQAVTVFKGKDCAWTTQLKIRVDDRLISVADVGCVELKIAIFYDGEHHLKRRQRDKDFARCHEIQSAGWTVIVLTAGMLHEPERWLPDLAGYIDRIRARQVG
ncbi:hypothetical protein [Corynebacterium frankenforstense]|uniref:hypothetical protein n=1 Tax=Corynebacterium frankenforstense TaxID=1230998 RepID=UPI0026EB490F|nr:hypothetical protein [Corynebacterium frankenforstense]